MNAAPTHRTLTLSSEADTVALAEALAQGLPTACVVALEGTLGAGKTRLVRAFAEACGIDAKSVTSPTFTLWQTYEGSRRIHHLDAYRVADEDEFEALGALEGFAEEAITFVEWAERVEGSLPPERMELSFAVTGDTERVVRLQAHGPTLEVVVRDLNVPGISESSSPHRPT